MYNVFSYELENIGNNNAISTLCLSFFGATFSAAIACLVVITTIPELSANTYAIYFNGTIGFSILSLILLAAGLITFKSARKQIQQIKDSHQVQIRESELKDHDSISM